MGIEGPGLPTEDVELEHALRAHQILMDCPDLAVAEAFIQHFGLQAHGTYLKKKMSSLVLENGGAWVQDLSEPRKFFQSLHITDDAVKAKAAQFLSRQPANLFMPTSVRAHEGGADEGF